LKRWFESLRSGSDIAALRRRGVRLGASTLHGYGDRRAERGSVAIAVSKAVGGSVVRNRVRRRIRGALEALAPCERPVRLLVVVRPQAAAVGYDRIAADVSALLAGLDRALP
jgi:ribonuclease P protein component